MKITIKYRIEYGQDIIECKTLDEVQRKVKHLTDVDRYIIQIEMKGKKVINETLIGL